MGKKKRNTTMSGRFGWIPPEERSYGVEKEVDRVMQSMPLLSTAGRPIADTGQGKVVLLHKVLAQVAGTYPIYRQTIGDCVSHGWAKGVMTRIAVEVLIASENERWPGADIASEWIYGTSRVLVGKGRLGNSDGSVGAWAARAVQEHGTLIRQKYGSYDLTRYSGQRAKDWGFRRLPADELEPTADEHQVANVAVANSYEQARDAIANGYPVPVCSNQGFREQRDSEGFAKPQGSWSHCMCFVAVDDTGRRPGLLCDNSWGPDWISGPKRHDQPDGSFWVDAQVADRMLRGDDSFAVGGYDGFKRAAIDWGLL